LITTEAEIKHKKACLRRHYEQMTFGQAKRLISELEPRHRETIKSKRFKKRINLAKGYDFI